MLDDRYTDEKFSLQNPFTKMYKLIFELFNHDNNQYK